MTFLARNPTLVVVVPTRNRSELAMNAVRSVLRENAPGVRILVSDNSTHASEKDILAEFCAQFSANRVRYVAPQSDLSMTLHWEWAMQQALNSGNESHVTYLTDRMVIKPGGLAELLSISERYPQRIVSYNHDKVLDLERPIRLTSAPWTGKIFEIDSSHLLNLSSHAVLHCCLPRMLNCVVPREMVEGLKARWGSIFGSTAPDFFFAYRCLDLVDTIVFYDKGCLVHYALDRSNGMSQARGIPSADSRDFEAHLGVREQNYATPVPKLRTVPNAILHEYCVVRNLSETGRMPELDFAGYLGTNRAAIDEIEDPQLASEMHRTLRNARKRLPTVQRWGMVLTDNRYPDKLRRLGVAARNLSATGELLAQRFATRVPSWVARRLAVARETIPREDTFCSAGDAIAYANKTMDGRCSHPLSVLSIALPTGHLREVEQFNHRQNADGVPLEAALGVQEGHGLVPTSLTVK